MYEVHSRAAIARSTSAAIRPRRRTAGEGDRAMVSPWLLSLKLSAGCPDNFVSPPPTISLAGPTASLSLSLLSFRPLLYTCTHTRDVYVYGFIDGFFFFPRFVYVFDAESIGQISRIKVEIFLVIPQVLSNSKLILLLLRQRQITVNCFIIEANSLFKAKLLIV